MATSSPYSQNDYQVFNARPNNLPVNDILKAFVAKDEYWKLGAEAVKNRFDNMLDLDLSKEENRKIRDNFIEKSQQDLQKINSQDLSDPNVKKAGMKIFDPILQDPGILYDDQATKHYKKVLADADKYRNEDGGKYYNEDNVAYALDGWDDFIKSPDRMAGKQYIRKAKEYTPYYDFQGEIAPIMKECKPSSASSDAINGMYIKHTSIESRTASQVTGCLDAGLSERAKQQISIHGYATYKNNPQALRDSYLPLVSGQAQNIGTENARINGILANKDKLAKMTPEELQKMGVSKDMLNPQFLKNLEAQRNDNDLRLQNLNQTMSKLSSGDLSPISGDNFNTVAGAVYAKHYLQNYGRGFDYEKVDQSTKGDPVQLQIFHENKLDARQEDNQRFDARMLNSRQQFEMSQQKDQQQFQYGLETMKEKMQLEKEFLKGSLKAGNLKDVNLTADQLGDARHLNAAFEGDTEDDSYEKITNRRKEIANERTDMAQRAMSQFANIPGFPKGKRWSDPETQEWYNAYTKTLPKDDPMWKVIVPFEKRIGSLIAEEDILKNNQQDIDEEVFKHNKDLYDRKNLPSTTVKIGGATVSANDIQDALEGKSSKIQIKKLPGEISSQFTAPGSGGASITYPEEIYINGIKISPADIRASGLINLKNTVETTNNSHIRRILAERNRIAKDKTTIQTEGFSFPQLNENDSPFKQRIAQRLGVADNNIDNISIGDTDLKGNVIVTINPDSKDAGFQKTTINALKKTYGVNDIKPVKGSENSFVLSGFDKFDIIDKTRLSNIYNPVVRGLEKRVTLNTPKNTGLIRSGDPRYQYGIEVQAGLTPSSFVYRIYDNKGETKDIMYDRKEALQKFELLIDPRDK